MIRGIFGRRRVLDTFFTGLFIVGLGYMLIWLVLSGGPA